MNKFTSRVNEILASAAENKNREKNGILPANTLLLRGAGSYHKVPTLDERFGLRSACIAGGALYKGVATFVGMDIFMVPEATGSKNTSLKAKALAVKKALSQGYTFVLLHIKATDSFSHDGDLKGKTAFIEKIDREIIPTLMKTGAYLIVTGDHSTPCSRKNHSAHEVPIIIYGKDELKDKVSKFDELSCMDGGLGHIEGKDVMRLMLNLLEKSLKFGS